MGEVRWAEVKLRPSSGAPNQEGTHACEHARRTGACLSAAVYFPVVQVSPDLLGPPCVAGEIGLWPCLAWAVCACAEHVDSLSTSPERAPGKSPSPFAWAQWCGMVKILVRAESGLEV